MAGRILILEDDMQLRAMLAEVLTEEGYEVSLAERGAQAIQLAQQQEFDLMVADIRMEGMDGLEAVEKVKQHRPDVGSLVITGYSTEADCIRAVRLGVGDYLKKPFDMDDFLQTVGRLVQRQRHEHEAAERERALLKATLKALETIARSLDLAQPGQRLVESARLAASWARNAGLPEPETLQLACLARGLQQAGIDELDLPARVQELLDETGDSRPAQLLALAEARAFNQPAPPVDPELKALTEQPEPPEDKRRARARLLMLARVLEESRDPDSACLAYQEIVGDGPSLEAVEAHLGLARQQDKNHALKAIEVAAQIGPQAKAQTQLEAALILPDQALQLLQEAYPLLLGTSKARANLLATLCQGKPPDEGAVQALLYTEDLIASCRWLAPYLIRHQSPVVNRALARLQKEAPAEFSKVTGTSAPQEGLPKLRLFSLGGFEIFRGEDLIDSSRLRNQKARYLLACLAGSGGREVPDDILIESFWPEDMGRAKQSLYQMTSLLRRSLRPPDWKEELDYIVRASTGLQLNPAVPRWHDLDELERCLRDGEEQPRERARELLWQAARLYRGPYLEGCYLDWAITRRNRLEETIVGVLTKLAGWAHEDGRHEEALECGQRLLALDPCSMAAHQTVMRAQLALGRPEAVVRQYEQCRKRLHNEFGLEPSIAILELHQRALLCL